MNERVTIGPAAPNQQRLWLMAKLHPGNWSYHIASSLELTGTLEVPVLRRALRDLAARHEALRTTFTDSDEVLQLRVAHRAEPRFEFVDVSDQARPRQAAEARAAAVRREPMDLVQGPLFRVLLCRTAPRRHVLTLYIHHILADGWTLGILWEELGQLYTKRLGARVELEPVGLSYLAHAAERTEQQKSPQAQAERRQWLDRLREVDSDNSLRTDRSRPVVPSFGGRTLELPLEADLVEQLRAAARATGSTLFMLLVAAFAADLAHFDRRDDVVVAIQTSGRSDPRTARTAGFFVNTLPLRFEFDGAPALAQLVDQAREGTLAASAAEHVTYEQLAQELSPAGDRSMNPLAQVAFQLMNVPIPAVRFGDLTAQRWWDTTSGAKFDLSVMMVPDASTGLLGLVTYAEELFDESTVRELWRAYVEVLRALVRDPAAKLWELRLLDEERKTLITAWAHGPAPAPAEPPSLLATLARQAMSDRTAITAGPHRSTYAELWSRAASAAVALRAVGLRRGEVVAVACAARSETVRAVLGAWRAGAGVLILDPGPLTPRAAELLARLGTVRGLCSGGVQPPVPGLSWTTVPAGQFGADQVPDEWALDPADTAYVVSTSGSTGRPRAVAATMGAFSAYVSRAAAALGPDRTVLQIPPLSFDPGMRDVFTTLLAGAELVIPEGVADDPVEAVATALLAGSADTVLAIVPSILESVCRRLAAQDAAIRLRTVRCCGEALPRETAALALGVLGCVPHNDYGPTECTMISVSGQADPARVRTRLMPIGRPVEGVRSWVLGRGGQLLPPGFTGEIHLGGAHVTAGYLGDPEGTEQRFVPHPHGAARSRLHRTGDLGYFDADGVLHWLGRADRQVKVRGMRIDVVEVENSLARHPAVADAVVAVLGEGSGRRLVAYAVAEGTTPVELRDHLRRCLPRASVPAVVELLPRIPRSARGKVQWSLLPRPSTAVAERAPLRDTFEKAIAEIWREVLARPQVSAEDDFFDLVAAGDDFFDLGGHSLAAIRMAARVSELAGCQVTVQDVFDHPTLNELAVFARPGRRSGISEEHGASPQEGGRHSI